MYSHWVPFPDAGAPAMMIPRVFNAGFISPSSTVFRVPSPQQQQDILGGEGVRALLCYRVPT
eukprot:11850038-Ditylum_brightwellii.AAC.1